MIEGRVRTRPLGGTGIEVSEIGLGCGNWGREIDEDSSNRLMDYAVERGITLFDTGEAYGGGESYETRKRVYGTDDVREASLEKGSSERIIGTWMRKNGCRGDITVMSKFNSGASADNIPRALSGSLGRLDTDFVDILPAPHPGPGRPGRRDGRGAFGRGRRGPGGRNGLLESLRRAGPGGAGRQRRGRPSQVRRAPDRLQPGVAGHGARGPAALPGRRHRRHGVQPAGRGLPDGQVHPRPELSGGLQVPYNARAPPTSTSPITTSRCWRSWPPGRGSLACRRSGWRWRGS